MPIPTRNPIRSSANLEAWLRRAAVACLACIVIACTQAAWAADAPRADISISGQIEPKKTAIVMLTFMNNRQLDAEAGEDDRRLFEHQRHARRE